LELQESKHASKGLKNMWINSGGWNFKNIYLFFYCGVYS